MLASRRPVLTPVATTRLSGLLGTHCIRRQPANRSIEGHRERGVAVYERFPLQLHAFALPFGVSFSVRGDIVTMYDRSPMRNSRLSVLSSNVAHAAQTSRRCIGLRTQPTPPENVGV
jgi:hypothetical protein